MSTIKKPTRIALGIAGLLALVVALQNFDATEIDFLFWHFSVPLALLLVLTALLGIAVGYLVFHRKKKKKDAAVEESGPYR